MTSMTVDPLLQSFTEVLHSLLQEIAINCYSSFSYYTKRLPLHNAKVNILCGSYLFWMTGPYFYEVSNQKEPACYCNTLQIFWVTQLRRMRQRVRNVRSQQGGERHHVTRQNKTFLRVRSISQFGNMFGSHVHRSQQPQTFFPTGVSGV
jgi:hypothetical protein